MISMGGDKEFLSFDEVNDLPPGDIVSSDQIDDWLSTLGGEGIEIVDSASQVRVDEKSTGPDAEEARPTPEPTRSAEAKLSSTPSATSPADSTPSSVYYQRSTLAILQVAVNT